MSKKKISDSLDDGSLAFFVQGLILLYMLSLSLETVPSLNRYADIFSTISIITAVPPVSTRLSMLLFRFQARVRCIAGRRAWGENVARVVN